MIRATLCSSSGWQLY